MNKKTSQSEGRTKSTKSAAKRGNYFQETFGKKMPKKGRNKFEDRNARPDFQAGEGAGSKRKHTEDSGVSYPVPRIRRTEERNDRSKPYRADRNESGYASKRSGEKRHFGTSGSDGFEDRKPFKSKQYGSESAVSKDSYKGDRNRTGSGGFEGKKPFKNKQYGSEPTAPNDRYRGDGKRTGNDDFEGRKPFKNKRYESGPATSNDSYKGDRHRTGSGGFKDKKPFKSKQYGSESAASKDSYKGDRNRTGSGGFEGRKPFKNKQYVSELTVSNDRYKGDKKPADFPKNRNGKTGERKRQYFDSENPYEKAYSATEYVDRKNRSFNPNHPRNVEPARPETEQMPLNKFIAHCGICSRRDAVALIKDGKVKVNGELQQEPGFKISDEDQVELNGKLIYVQKNLVYILLNKPKGYITTTDDPKGRRTVMDIFANHLEERIFPVGRLDRNTTGLLLLTNDGALAQKLSHPKYHMRKVYQVTLDRNLDSKDYERIKEGVVLEDGKAEVDQVEYLDEANKLGLEIHSGKNRIVRRIFESLGYVVDKLDRVMYAGLTKKNLLRGKWRFLSHQEVINLKHIN